MRINIDPYILSGCASILSNLKEVPEEVPEEVPDPLIKKFLNSPGEMPIPSNWSARDSAQKAAMLQLRAEKRTEELTIRLAVHPDNRRKRENWPVFHVPSNAGENITATLTALSATD